MTIIIVILIKPNTSPSTFAIEHCQGTYSQPSDCLFLNVPLSLPLPEATIKPISSYYFLASLYSSGCWVYIEMT